MEIAVLDQATIYPNDSTPKDRAIAAVHQSVHLARDCEELGWDRYWVSEHHGSENGCGSPEVLVTAISAATSRLRVGTGAVLLPHYAPLKVATTFNLLERLYPNRIDLGIGRGPGGSTGTISRLASLSTHSYSFKIDELIGYLNPDRGPYNDSISLPASSVPQFFLNGSTQGSAATAAAHGIPFVLAQFIHETPQPDIVSRYRDAFKSGITTAPFVGIGLVITCTDDIKDVAYMRKLGVGAPGIGNVRSLVGTPEEIEPELTKLLDLYHPDLLAVATYCPDYRLRVRSYELVRDLVATRRRSA